MNNRYALMNQRIVSHSAEGNGSGGGFFDGDVGLEYCPRWERTIRLSIWGRTSRLTRFSAFLQGGTIE